MVRLCFGEVGESGLDFVGLLLWLSTAKEVSLMLLAVVDPMELCMIGRRSILTDVLLLYQLCTRSSNFNCIFSSEVNTTSVNRACKEENSTVLHSRDRL